MEEYIVVRSAEDMARLVASYGFLPLLKNEIPGFSIEEHTDPAFWFKRDVEGPWEWKGPVIQSTGAAYGKFFHGTSGYVSAELFADFANWRRDGYDFEARFNDGLSSYEDNRLYGLIEKNAPILSKRLKMIGGYGKGGKKGFDTCISRLQKQCYVLISDFVYQTDRFGEPYGWGVAEYSTPENWMGSGFTDAVYQRTPRESRERLERVLKNRFPEFDEFEIRRILD